MSESEPKNLSEGTGDTNERPEVRIESTNQEAQVLPIEETEDSVSYLGVRLDKATNSGKAPKREQYANYVNDPYALQLQKKIATAFAQNQPILIEGGTSIGKTTTVKKMAADLGWEVHYANLNGATDVEDLMGRYIPNPNRKGPEDPEYIFADGRVTSGLRQEEGKTKVIILDEFNSASPNILIRLHEVLDALERDGDIILSEDASEAVAVSRERTKIIALMNPPGKGYLGRETLDPAQLRRWVYQKEVNDLPTDTFTRRTEVAFGLAPTMESNSNLVRTPNSEHALSPEQLSEIPGIQQMLVMYQEFHRAAQEMLKNRQIAQDQPQPFSYDVMEMQRVASFVSTFYRGDITRTFQEALLFYYANKLEDSVDRQKLKEQISHVKYVPVTEASKRRSLEGANVATPEDSSMGMVEDLDIMTEPVSHVKLEGSKLEQVTRAAEILGNDFLGPDQVQKAFGIELSPDQIPDIPFSEEELLKAVAFEQMLVLRTNKLSTGEPATMKNMSKSLEATFKSKGKGKILYDTDWYNGEDFYTKETPRLGWALVGKDLVPNSAGNEYLQQTEAIVDYLKGTVFKTGVPAVYREAISEFESQKKKLTALVGKDWQSAAEQLANLKINQMTRQTPVEALYDILIRFQNQDERQLENRYTWTNRRTSDGHLVHVGDFDSDGADVAGRGPGDSNGNLGVSFSRSQ
jgi:MoxR-like ATPase